MKVKTTLVTLVFSFLFACSSEPEFPKISEPNWVVPRMTSDADIATLPSNNNVAIAMYQERLYMAWRSSLNHFASSTTKMFVMSSSDLGKTWKSETEISIGKDVREPTLIVMNDALILNYLELGVNPAAFEPKHVWRRIKKNGAWSEPEKVFEQEGIVPWEVKVRGANAWMTAYRGGHYTGDESKIQVYFKKSSDGLKWEDVDSAKPVIYEGGASELGFEFDADQNVWGVTRNEDGDASGFGSHLAFAPAGNLGQWEFPKKSDPYRYDSPRMLRAGNELYLIARRNIRYDSDDNIVHEPFWQGPNIGSLSVRRVALMGIYSLLPKRTAIYKIDRANRKVVWLKDMPSAADTAFASIVQLSEKEFLIANYSNPIDSETERWSWIAGQTSFDRGTQIYLTTVTFE